ncbi:MAG: DUF2931 family protein [Bacteroidetes bacterium]|nr:DUF2931 family protein [Bacteroidota bacterium]
MKHHSAFALFLLIFFSNCKAQMSTYDWLPTECAPKNFPVEIVKGDFIFENGRTLYIPDRQFVNNGWGEFGSTHIVGDEQKPLPSRLAITWFSFLDDRFYTGNFELPGEKLKKFFEEGYISPLTAKKKIYDNILVGLTAGGGVAVWVMGDKVTKELAFFQAHDTSIAWPEFVDNPEYPRKRYIATMLEQAMSPNEVAELRAHPPNIELWKTTYRTLYNWAPSIIGKAKPLSLLINYYNGEREFVNFEDKTEAQEISGRPAPKSASFYWQSSLNVKMGAELSFDSEEIFAALNKLHELNPKAKITLQLRVNDADQTVRIFLNNDKVILELLKTTIRVFEH